jgi:hypothetical protein
MAAQSAFRAFQTGIEWTAEGPQLANSAQARLQIDRDKHQKLTEILREMFQEYQVVEAKHKSPPGRVITLAIPRNEIDDLENKLWSRIDNELDTRQQALMRSFLRLTPPERESLAPGQSINDILIPGIFGWGSQQVSIQVGKKGTWYTWTIHSQNAQNTDSSPEAPPQLRRFWDTPEKAEQ